jgi:hypothetical protein
MLQYLLIKLIIQQSSTQQISKKCVTNTKKIIKTYPQLPTPIAISFLFSPCKNHEYDQIEVDIVITSTSQHIAVSL